MILGIDPGRDKCGLAVMNSEQQTVKQEIIETEEIIDTIEEWRLQYQFKTIVIGDGTSSGELKKKLKGNYKEQIKIKEVDETNSTLEARRLYWQQNPPRGWRRLIPTSFQMPPRPVDDYVAIILIKRFLTENKE